MVWQTRIGLCLLLCAVSSIVVGQEAKVGDGERAWRGSDLGATNAILISKYMFQTGSEAYFTSDRKEIEQLVHLFRNNRSAPHACGYHWLIWFRESPTEAVPVSHNEECESYEANNAEIKSTLKRYFDSIRNYPTSFISNVWVAASVQPEEAAKQLEDSEYHLFFLLGTLERLPHIRIRSRSISGIPQDRSDWESAKSKNVRDAEDRLRREIEELRKNYEIVHFTKLEVPYSSFGGGKIEDRAETKIYFRYGSGLESIENQLKETELLEKTSPSYYVVQLVSAEKYSPALKQRLTTKHQFILNVLPYPETQ